MRRTADDTVEIALSLFTRLCDNFAVHPRVILGISCEELTGVDGGGDCGRFGLKRRANRLIQDLGVCPFSGLVEYSARNLSIDEVRRLFGQTFRYKPMAGNPWHILLIEELELIVSRHVNAALKDELRTSPLQGQLPSLSRAWEKGKTSMRSPVAPQENDATARKRLHLPQKAKQDRR